MFWLAANTGKSYSVLTLLTVPMTQSMHAQTEANIETAAIKTTGSSHVALGAGVQVYTVEVKDGDNFPLLDSLYLGKDDEVPVGNGGSDTNQTAPKRLIAADFPA